MRPPARLLGLAVAAALILPLIGCSSSPRSTASVRDTVPNAVPDAVPETTRLELPITPRFTVASVTVHAYEAAPDLLAQAGTHLQGLLDRYLNNALVLPLRSGRPAGDLSTIFMSDVLPRLAGPDRAALLDEGLPAVSDVTVKTAAADLVALAGPDGVAVLVAGIKIEIEGEVEGTPLAVNRTGELHLAPEGDYWKISAYDIRVERHTAGGVTTTTAP